MGHAWRADAGQGEPVVEPCGGPISEVGAHRLMNRREHLEQNEGGADQGERAGEAVAALHGANEAPHRNREHGGQHAPQEKHDPPRSREADVGFCQNAEKLPFIAFA